MSNTSHDSLSEHQIDRIAMRVAKVVLDCIGCPDGSPRQAKPHRVCRRETSSAQASDAWQSWMDRFLVYLESASVGQAARKTGIARSTAYKYKRRVPAFSARWDRILALDDEAQQTGSS